MTPRETSVGGNRTREVECGSDASRLARFVERVESKLRTFEPFPLPEPVRLEIGQLREEAKQVRQEETGVVPLPSAGASAPRQWRMVKLDVELIRSRLSAQDGLHYSNDDVCAFLRDTGFCRLDGYWGTKEHRLGVVQPDEVTEVLSEKGKIDLPAPLPLEDHLEGVENQKRGATSLMRWRLMLSHCVTSAVSAVVALLVAWTWLHR